MNRASGLVSTTTFGTEGAQISATKIRIADGEFFFDYSDGAHQIKNIKLGMPGFHNIQNAIAASAVALHLGVSPGSVKSSLANFKGIKRRFELIARTEQTVFYDDYAHHPTEVEAFIRSAKTLHPNRKLTVIFQPHLYTRTRDFADGFASSLSLADQVILMPIYPARELPIEGVNSEMILSKLTCPEKHLLAENKVLEFIAKQKPSLLATVGAGNIDQLVNPICHLLTGTSI